MREQGWCSGERSGLSLLLVLSLAPRGLSPGSPVFSTHQQTNISKFQLGLGYCQALYHEPLARVITQALPVFDIKFTFTFTFTLTLTFTFTFF